MKTIHIAELNKTFTNKEELFKALKDNEQKIISLKKATVYKSADKGQFASGSLNASQIKSDYDWMKNGYFYPIVNTTNYYDSHGDVHFPALWNKTIKEQSGRIHYVLDHELKVGSVIAWPDNVGLMLKPIEWSAVGKDYPGTTEALILEVAESDIVNQDAKSVYSAKRSVQGSVRMSYVTIKLGINSDSKEYIENKAYYNSRINEIANRQDVEDAGYFFGIEEAKLIKETSMVLFGSNDATSIVYPDAVDDTKGDDTDPPLPSMDYEKLLKAKLFTT
jgi:hypothetical protein